MRIIALAALLALTSACASVNYEDVKPGSFEGEVAVVWLRGTDGSGDGTFVYVPTQNRPLTFTRPETGTKGKSIQPGMMYTDGGSIPSFARIVDGLTPWNYGPAYIVHDWLFRAKQCLTDGSTKPEYDSIKELEFQDSAEIIAEAILALEQAKRVRKDGISGALVTAAVSSPFSYRFWTARGACWEVSDDDRKLAEDAVGRKAVVGREVTQFVVSRSTGKVEPRTGRVVAVIEYDDKPDKEQR